MVIFFARGENVPPEHARNGTIFKPDLCNWDMKRKRRGGRKRRKKKKCGQK